MSVPDGVRRWRDWFPIPTSGHKIGPIRWLLLEGNRLAVTGALLTFVFVTILGVGWFWTFEMQRLLTETDAVQTLLNSLLSGIILLVSIVVSINSIVLSYDITSVGSQEERIQEAMNLRKRIGRISEMDESPTDPDAFLEVMAEIISQRSRELARTVEETDGEFSEAVDEHVEAITETIGDVNETLDHVSGAEFGVLWKGLTIDYGRHMDRSNRIRTTYQEGLAEDAEEKFDDLMEVLELFATGKEYFKTLYYSQEVSELSRTLLVISLPAILVTATTILAINAGLLPDVWLLGLPPLLTFVAATFTVALAPFVVLTSYMLRLATVANQTASAGPFVLK